MGCLKSITQNIQKTECGEQIYATSHLDKSLINTDDFTSVCFPKWLKNDETKPKILKHTQNLR